MTQLCATRAIKNARHVQGTAPHILPRTEPPEGFASRVPRDLLVKLHTPLAPRDLERVPGLGAVLAKAPVPRPRAAVVAPLFSGTLVFAAVTFRTSSGVAAVPPGDLAIAMSFARLAVGPISAYATQYGPNRVAVAANPVPFAASVPSGRYNDQSLQGWVNSIVTTNNLPSSTCVVILNPRGVVNVDADASQGVGGYHGAASVPYAFVNVMGQGLTVKDEANVYALALSHEIAEMVVDPRANLSNPEVCDGCAGNCGATYYESFDGSGRYLGGGLTPSQGYAFFINSVVRPAAATQCPAPGSSCAYAPP